MNKVTNVLKLEKDSAAKPDLKLVELVKSNIVKRPSTPVKKPGSVSASDSVEIPEKLIKAPVHSKRFTDGSVSWDCLSPDLVMLGNVRKNLRL